jgi:SpoVK/Ycf46/Vps4 family AAA+-type ATPase
MEKTPPLSSMKRKREESDKVRNMDDATEDDTEDNIMMKDTQADARAETTADARATAAETRAASDVWNILDKYKKTLEEVMMMLVEANNTIDSYKKRAAELETKLAEVSRQQSNGSYHALRGTVQARADAEEEQLRSQIRATILTNGENEKWEDVVGLKVAKEILEETIFDPIRYPEAFEGKRKTSKGILLYGPPGTGE